MTELSPIRLQLCGINPYDPALVNPASIDLRLGGEFINLETQSRFRADEITITPGQTILATTLEYIVMPTLYAGAVYLKSSMARIGLDHALAGWVDSGFHDELTRIPLTPPGHTPKGSKRLPACLISAGSLTRP